jgi:hypothetical protein
MEKEKTMPTSKTSTTKQKGKRVADRQVQQEIQWIEIPVFIHGISPDKNPATSRKQYHQLLHRVNAKFKQFPQKKFSDEKVFVTWGVPTDPSQPNNTDEYLAEVERKIQRNVKDSMGAAAYSNPFGFSGFLRDLLFFGVSDLIYYISNDGEQDVREHVFNYISQSIKKLDKGGGKNHYSLTLFGHSAGSVIAHDLLYHLFSDTEHESEKMTLYLKEMDALRKLVDGGRLRVRRLYTFGSPISPLVLRASSLVKKFRTGELLKPKSIGFEKNDELGKPRWVNFWSRHDFVSYPVEFLYSNENGLIEDHEVASSINPKDAHLGYWASDEMADYISKTY